MPYIQIITGVRVENLGAVLHVLENTSHKIWNSKMCTNTVAEKKHDGSEKNNFFYPQKLLECDQKPLYQYIKNIYLLPTHFCMF